VSEAVAAVGDNTIDEYLGDDYLGGAAYSFVGGNALNVAVQLARLGRPAGYFGAVGPDADGERVRQSLVRAGVDVAGLVTVPGRTSVSRIRVDASGDRHFEFEDFAVCAQYAPRPEALELLAACRAVHIGLLPAAAVSVRAWLTARGVLVSQDCAVTRGYENLDIAFCSQAAAGAPATAVAEAAIAGGARLAVVTCGAEGSVAHDGRAWWRAAAVPAEVVDTTGAGDGYAAGFLDARLAGADVDQAMAAGSACAAAACAHQGAWPQDPLSFT
jgi:fructoselysine 6-kinase